MSTKIYTAYKLKDPDNFEEWLTKARNKALDAGYDVFKQHMQGILSYMQTPDTDKELSELILTTYQDIREKYRDASRQNLVFENWDTELCINVYSDEYYIRPYPMRGICAKVWDFLKEDTDLEDFHYQNQTDKPNNVSDNDWYYRKNIWNIILNPVKRESVPNLIVSIISLDSYVYTMDWIKFRDEILKERNN